MFWLIMLGHYGAFKKMEPFYLKFESMDKLKTDSDEYWRRYWHVVTEDVDLAKQQKVYAQMCDNEITRRGKKS
jgi:hypothetical protein